MDLTIAEEQLIQMAAKDCHIDSSVVRFRIVGSRMELWDMYGNPHVWTIPTGMLPHAPEATGGGNAEPVKVRAGIKPAPTTPRKGRLRKTTGTNTAKNANQSKKKEIPW